MTYFNRQGTNRCGSATQIRTPSSRPIHPHPMFMGLVASAIARANPALAPQEFLPAVRRWLPATGAEGDDERQSPSMETGPGGRI